MPLGYRITGIQPRELDGQSIPVRLMYWTWVRDLGITAKDRDLAQGLDAFGSPLRPISPATRKHRKSEMTPSGKGDPNAPPLTPGRELSRTRSLLAGTAYPDRAEFFWRFDPWTGNTWAEILTYQQEEGRDVFGLSPASIQWVRQQALAKWRAWLKNPTIPLELVGRTNVPPLPAAGAVPTDITQFYGKGRMGLENATLGINAPSRAAIEASTQRQGGMTEAELRRFYRGTAPANVQGRPGTEYNRLLQSVWGSPGKGRGIGGIEPLTPPRPARVAMKPAPVVKPKPGKVNLPITNFFPAVQTVPKVDREQINRIAANPPRAAVSPVPVGLLRVQADPVGLLQDTVNQRIAEYYRDHPGTAPITVIFEDGVFFIDEGHHRAAGAILRGDFSVRGLIFQRKPGTVKEAELLVMDEWGNLSPYKP